MKDFVCVYCGKVLHSKAGLTNHMKYCTMNPNRIDPPTKGRTCSEEHKANVSKSLKGHQFSDEHKKKLSECAKGRKHTEEWKIEHSNRMSGEGNSFYGKHHSEETKRLISLSKSGKPISDEHKKKLQDWNNQRWAEISDDAKQQFVEKCRERATEYWEEMSETERFALCEKMRSIVNSRSIEERKEIYYKGVETKKKNQTISTSTIENLLIEYFNSNSIEYIYQYKSEEYPFMCDFYFPSKDLYVEIQGCWTHGERPYIEGDAECQQKLDIWKEKSITSDFYKSAIDTWTNRDVLKRNHAKEHNLNWIEIFSNDLGTCVDVINTYMMPNLRILGSSETL